MGRYKAIIGFKPRARSPASQRAEVAAGIAVLTRMMSHGRPHFVRRPKIAS